MRRLLVWGCLCSLVPSQVVRRQPATSPDDAVDSAVDKAVNNAVDNAATLYRLAVSELQPQLASGAVKMPAYAGDGGLGNIHTRNIKILPPQMAEMKAVAIAETVMARSLFAQAGARPQCAFAPDIWAAGEPARRALRDLIEIVAWHAVEVRVTNPCASCEAAIAILRYSRHCRVSCGVDELIQVLLMERRALLLLGDTLAALPAGDRRAEVVRRYIPVLQEHRQFCAKSDDYVRTVRDGVPALVELHRPRLRDVFMKVEGGFDAQGMVRALVELVDKVAKAPTREGITFPEWLAVMSGRLKAEVQPPTAAASVTEKTTYGMAIMLFSGGRRLRIAIETSNEALGKLLEQFDAGDGK